MATADDDIVWEEDDPDFALALSLSMDEKETNHSQSNTATGVKRPVQSVQLVDHESDEEEMWSEDDPDFVLALSMYLDEVEEQSSLNSGAEIPPDSADFISMSGCVVDQKLEQLDPNPDIWKLFRIFDDRFFDGHLKKQGVMLSWSPRMTSCAGICSWRSRTHFCEIRLSQPLLMLRPRSDLVETLIHEMIHAILFVTHQDDNHESHGQVFHHHMYRINKAAGCSISVFHNFHNEVRFYQKHVWKCDGPCNKRPPYFGIVRRAMNRAPGPKDYWFPRHQVHCGGTFVKIESPEAPAATSSQTSKSKGKSKGAKSPSKRPPKGTPDIRNFLTPDKPPDKSGPKDAKSGDPQTTQLTGSSNIRAPAPVRKIMTLDNIQAGNSSSSVKTATFTPFSGNGHVLGSCASNSVAAPQLINQERPAGDLKSSRSTTIEVIADPVPIELIELD